MFLQCSAGDKVRWPSRTLPALGRASLLLSHPSHGRSHCRPWSQQDQSHRSLNHGSLSSLLDHFHPLVSDPHLPLHIPSSDPIPPIPCGCCDGWSLAVSPMMSFLRCAFHILSHLLPEQVLFLSHPPAPGDPHM